MKKHILRSVSLILAAVMLMAFAPRAFAESDLLADFDCNGKVTSDDAVYLLRYTLFPGYYPIEGYADFDGNGKITSDDAVYLLRYTLFPGYYPLIEEEQEKKYRRGTVKFEDMEYPFPDYDAMFELLDTARTGALDESITPEDLLEMLCTVYDAIREADDSYDVVYVLKSCDVTNEEINQLALDYYNNNGELERQYYELLAELLDIGYYDSLFEEWTEEDKQYVLDYVGSVDEEYTAMQARFSELVFNYYGIDSLEVEVDGETVMLGDITDDDVYLSELRKLCGSIYSEIVSIQKWFAERSGYDSAAEYLYYEEYYRDYTVEDIREMIENVKKYIVPVLRDALKSYRWVNAAVNDVFDYDEFFREYFASINPLMLEAYEYLREYDLYRLGEPDVGEPGGYSMLIYKYDMPVIYLQREYDYNAINSFIHEFGHFYESYYHGKDKSGILDICEIHSQANEFLFLPYYSEIFGEEIGENITENQIILGMYYIVQACLYSEFELRMFEGEYNDYDSIAEMFAELIDEFGLTDMHLFDQDSWLRVLHFFEVPMYYISYATSLVPAMQIYSAYVKDRETGIEIYNGVIERSDYWADFLEVLEEAGLDSPFEEATFIDLAEMMRLYFPE